MIRHADYSDVKRISFLIHEAWAKDLIDLVDPEASSSMTVEIFASKLKQDISSEAEIVIVYETGNNIIGYASGNTNAIDFDSEIVGLYVCSKAQQSGVGSRLFNEMKSLFKSQNKSSMIVWTFLDAPNNQFYFKKNPVKITHRDIVISAMKYSGIGFVYSL